MEYSKTIREILALIRPPEAPAQVNDEVPLLYAVRDGDEGWTLTTYPGEKLDALDRQVLWATFADVVADVLAQTVPEVQVLISSPAEYTRNIPGVGRLTYSYPPPASGMAERFWFERINDELPAINHEVARRISVSWPDYRRNRNVARRSPQNLKAARSASIDAARRRNQRPGQGGGSIR